MQYFVVVIRSTNVLNKAFKNGDLNFNACAGKIIHVEINNTYHFTSDAMNEDSKTKAAKKKMRVDTRPVDL